jgi:hypothetical protein
VAEIPTREVPGYHSLREISRSASTLVRRGVRTRDGVSVVIKGSARAYPALREEEARRNELDFLSELDSPHIIRAYGLERMHNPLLLIEEDFAGLPIGELFRTRTVPISTFLALAIQITDALAAVYARQIIHRDVSPDNILVDPVTLAVKLIDFGLASLARERHDSHSPKGLQGTLAYISPEQTCRMNRAVDCRSDRGPARWLQPGRDRQDRAAAGRRLLRDRQVVARPRGPQADRAAPWLLHRGQVRPVPSQRSVLGARPGVRPDGRDDLSLLFLEKVRTRLGVIPPVRCHISELNPCFLNLIVNASHAIADAVAGSTARGLIEVTSDVDDGLLVVAISDTGGGIPIAIRDKIFDPFFTTKELGRGTGQGLAIARRVIVDKHGGSLSFETELGRGTTFYVRLPLDLDTGPFRA